MKAVIPAAGLGTRFLPATKAQPKEMLPIVDKPAIQFVVEEAINSGIDDIIIITGRGKRAIEDHFDRSFELEYVLREKGEDGPSQTGSGHIGTSGHTLSAAEGDEGPGTRGILRKRPHRK
jgi:UTP-glucose-1-phosphate uridylyltransferase